MILHERAQQLPARWQQPQGTTAAATRAASAHERRTPGISVKQAIKNGCSNHVKRAAGQFIRKRLCRATPACTTLAGAAQSTCEAQTASNALAGARLGHSTSIRGNEEGNL